MVPPILIDCILLVGFTGCLFFALTKQFGRSVRAPWANLVFAISGVIGIARSSFSFARHMHWLVLAPNTDHGATVMLHNTGGLLLGFLLALTLARQLAPRQERTPREGASTV